MAVERSGMLALPAKCNGEADGFQCIYYWATRNKMNVANPTAVKKGQKMRMCLLPNVPEESRELGLNAIDVATYCNQYKASDRHWDQDFDPVSSGEVMGMNVDDVEQAINDNTQREISSLLRTAAAQGKTATKPGGVP